MKRELKIVLALLVVLTVSACANGYEKFYQPVNIPPPPSIQPLNFSGEPTLMPSSGNIADDVRRMYEDGYGMIGSSNFVGPAQDQKGAISQAKKVGAAIVIVWSKYQSTATGAIPITTNTAQTTYSNGTVSAYGSGGFVNGNYSGTSTTYTPQTTMIPYSIDRYDQVAAYFKPLERKGAGINVAPLSPQQRQQMGTNKGVVIQVVRKGSPAFMADVLPGDIVLSINDQAVFDAQSAIAALTAARGGVASMAIVRNGSQLSKSVPIPAADW